MSVYSESFLEIFVPRGIFCTHRTWGYLSASEAANIQFSLKSVYARGNGCQGHDITRTTPKGAKFLLYLLRFSRYSQKTKNKVHFPQILNLTPSKIAIFGYISLKGDKKSLCWTLKNNLKEDFNKNPKMSNFCRETSLERRKSSISK